MLTTLIIYAPTDQPTPQQRANIAQLYEGELVTTERLPARTPAGAKLVTLRTALMAIAKGAQS